MKRDPRYDDVERLYGEMLLVFPGLHSTRLIVNYAGLRSSRIIFAEAEAGAEEVHGIFGGKNGPVNSLIQETPVTTRRDIVHLEAYILRSYEKAHHREIAKGIALMNRIDFRRIRQWAEMLQEMQFFAAGLRFVRNLRTLGYPVCRPDPAGESIAFTDLYPLDQDHENSGRYRPYTAQVASQGITLVTGANHSGKTTYALTVTQCLALAQLGFYVPAKAFSFHSVRRFVALFAPGEAPEHTYSRFQLEAIRLGDVLRSAEEGGFLFLNEPFTSTNPEEAIPLLCRILSDIARRGMSVLLVTHLYDLFFLLKEQPDVSVKSFITQTRDLDGSPFFDYTVLEAEPQGKNYARWIAREYGLTVDEADLPEERKREVEAFLEEGRKYDVIEASSKV